MTRTKRNILLAPEVRHALEAFTSTGNRSGKLLKRAEIILALDSSEGRRPDTETRIAGRIGVSRQTIQMVKKDFENATSLSAFLHRKKRETPPVPAKITGEVEARIIALACEAPPVGFSKWSLRLLADTCVERQYVDAISHTTVSQIL
jgi:hypothetical protein